MAKVRFRTNVGSVDAKNLGLGADLSKLLKGEEMDVADDLAQQLCSPNGAGVILADPVVSEGKVKAVASPSVKT